MAFPSITYSFVNGPASIIDAGEVNSNFQDLVSAFNDGAKDANMNAASFVTLNVSGASNLVSIIGTSLTVATATISGDSTCNALNAIGLVTLDDRLIVDGVSTLSDTTADGLQVADTATINSLVATAAQTVTLNVTGSTNFVDATGTSLVVETANMSGDTTCNALNAAGLMTLDDQLIVSGNTTLSDVTSAGLQVTASATINDLFVTDTTTTNLNVTGDVILGDLDVTDLTVTGDTSLQDTTVDTGLATTELSAVNGTITNLTTTAFNATDATIVNTLTTGFNSTDSTTVNLNISGKVGIGTSDPQKTFHFYSTTDDDGLQIESNSRVLHVVQYQGSNPGDIFGYSKGGVASVNSEATMRIGSLSNTLGLGSYGLECIECGTNQRVTMPGSLGIGTHTPVVPFHVFEYSDSLETRFQNWIGNSFAHFKNNTNGLKIGVEDSTGGSIISDTSANSCCITSVNLQDLTLGCAGTQKIRIEKTGRIFFNDNFSGSTGGSDARYNTSTDELFYDTSTKRVKENIRDSSSSETDFIYKIPVKTYDRKDGCKKDEIGIIAEDLEKVAPSYCCYNAKGEIVTYNKSDLVPALIKELQLLRSEVNSIRGI